MTSIHALPALPNGWEPRLGLNGRVYYYSFQSQTIQILPPPEIWNCLFNLPYGWELASDYEENSYFINHMLQSVTYDDPREQDTSEDNTTTHTTNHHPRTCTITRDDSLGFGFIAGSEKPVIIRSVSPGGPSDNKLLPGDYIIKIGDENVKNTDRERVIQLIRGCHNSVTLTVVQPSRTASSSFLKPEKKLIKGMNRPRVRFADDSAMNGENKISGSSRLLVVPGVLRVILEEGQIRSFQFNQETTAGDVVVALCEKLNIIHSQLYALVLSAPEDQKDLARNSEDEEISHFNEILIAPWDSIAKVVSNPALKYHDCHFRLAFIAKDVHKLSRDDPKSFQYLYVQCVNDVVSGKVYQNDLDTDELLKLASLQIIEMNVTQNPDKLNIMQNKNSGRKLSFQTSNKISVKQIEKEYGLSRFLPPDVLADVNSNHSKENRKTLQNYIKTNYYNYVIMGGTGMDQKGFITPTSPNSVSMSTENVLIKLRMQYLKTLSHLHPYGGSYFEATILDVMESDITLIVGHHYGISQLIKSKTKMASLFGDFAVVGSVEIAPCPPEARKTTVRVDLKDMAPLVLAMHPLSALNFAFMISGYCRVYDNNDMMLTLPLTNSEIAPDYYGQHRVRMSNWNYPPDDSKEPTDVTKFQYCDFSEPISISLLSDQIPTSVRAMFQQNRDPGVNGSDPSTTLGVNPPPSQHEQPASTTADDEGVAMVTNDRSPLSSSVSSVTSLSPSSGIGSVTSHNHVTNGNKSEDDEEWNQLMVALSVDEEITSLGSNKNGGNEENYAEHGGNEQNNVKNGGIEQNVVENGGNEQNIVENDGNEQNVVENDGNEQNVVENDRNEQNVVENDRNEENCVENCGNEDNDVEIDGIVGRVYEDVASTPAKKSESNEIALDVSVNELENGNQDNAALENGGISEIEQENVERENTKQEIIKKEESTVHETESDHAIELGSENHEDEITAEKNNESTLRKISQSSSSSKRLSSFLPLGGNETIPDDTPDVDESHSPMTREELEANLNENSRKTSVVLRCQDEDEILSSPFPVADLAQGQKKSKRRFWFRSNRLSRSISLDKGLSGRNESNHKKSFFRRFFSPKKSYSMNTGKGESTFSLSDDVMPPDGSTGRSTVKSADRTTSRFKFSFLKGWGRKRRTRTMVITSDDANPHVSSNVMSSGVYSVFDSPGSQNVGENDENVEFQRSTSMEDVQLRPRDKSPPAPRPVSFMTFQRSTTMPSQEMMPQTENQPTGMTSPSRNSIKSDDTVVEEPEADDKLPMKVENKPPNKPRRLTMENKLRENFSSEAFNSEPVSPPKAAKRKAPPPPPASKIPADEDDDLECEKVTEFGAVADDVTTPSNEDTISNHSGETPIEKSVIDEKELTDDDVTTPSNDDTISNHSGEKSVIDENELTDDDVQDTGDDVTSPSNDDGISNHSNGEKCVLDEKELTDDDITENVTANDVMANTIKENIEEQEIFEQNEANVEENEQTDRPTFAKDGEADFDSRSISDESENSIVVCRSESGRDDGAEITRNVTTDHEIDMPKMAPLELQFTDQALSNHALIKGEFADGVTDTNSAIIGHTINISNSNSNSFTMPEVTPEGITSPVEKNASHDVETIMTINHASDVDKNRPESNFSNSFDSQNIDSIAILKPPVEFDNLSSNSENSAEALDDVTQLTPCGVNDVPIAPFLEQVTQNKQAVPTEKSPNSSNSDVEIPDVIPDIDINIASGSAVEYETPSLVEESITVSDKVNDLIPPPTAFDSPPKDPIMYPNSTHHTGCLSNSNDKENLSTDDRAITEPEKRIESSSYKAISNVPRQGYSSLVTPRLFGQKTEYKPYSRIKAPVLKQKLDLSVKTDLTPSTIHQNGNFSVPKKVIRSVRPPVAPKPSFLQ